MEKKTILVVDDSVEVGEFLKASLEDFGFKVIFCEEGEHAIVYLAGADALITDFRMGGMSGVELARKAKLQRESLPVLIMTAGSLDDIPKDHLANKIISKTFDVGPILLWLREVAS
ncbi:MAG: response regulator [Minisyncoccia bacterium]